jgi:hypothetical protein
MKLLALALVALSLTACSSPEDQAREALLDNIEQTVRLPPGAKPLQSYVRYYAPTGRGEVVGVFILPGVDELPPGQGCEQLREDGTTVPCTYDWPKSTGVGAGNRVWLSDYAKLPGPMRDASNCGLVSVVYRESDRHFVEVVCYGDTVTGY